MRKFELVGEGGSVETTLFFPYSAGVPMLLEWGGWKKFWLRKEWTPDMSLVKFERLPPGMAYHPPLTNEIWKQDYAEQMQRKT